MGLFVVFGVSGLSFAVFQAWKSDQIPKIAVSSEIDDTAIEAALAEAPKLPPVRLAAAGRSAQQSTDIITRASFETAETAEVDQRPPKDPPLRGAWLTGTIEAIDEKVQPAGRPMPTFEKPLRQPPVIDP